MLSPETLKTYNLGQLIAFKYHAEFKLVPFLAQTLLEKGFSADYHMGFNTSVNGAFVLRHLPDVSGDDLVWLSNKIAKYGTEGRNFDLCTAFSAYRVRPPVGFHSNHEIGSEFEHLVLINERTANCFWLAYDKRVRSEYPDYL